MYSVRGEFFGTHFAFSFLFRFELAHPQILFSACCASNFEKQCTGTTLVFVSSQKSLQYVKRQ